MANFVSGILALTIGVVVLANVFIYTVKNTSTAGWSTSEVALWGLVSLVSIAGIVYGAMNVFGMA